MEKLKMYFLLFSAMLFYQSSLYQRMVNCCFGSRWFGFLGSRDEKQLSLRGAPIRIPNPKPPIPKPPIIHYSNVECGVFSLIIPPLVSPSDSGGIFSPDEEQAMKLNVRLVRKCFAQVRIRAPMLGGSRVNNRDQPM